MKTLRDHNGRRVTASPGTGTEAGEPVDGIHIRTPEEDDMAEKSPRTTKYTLNGLRYRIRQGDPIPAGAVLDEERSEKAAPANRAEKAAPENRSTKATKAQKDD